MKRISFGSRSTPPPSGHPLSPSDPPIPSPAIDNMDGLSTSWLSTGTKAGADTATTG
jgi:hypothetical protein